MKKLKNTNFADIVEHSKFSKIRAIQSVAENGGLAKW